MNTFKIAILSAVTIFFSASAFAAPPKDKCKAVAVRSAAGSAKAENPEGKIYYSASDLIESKVVSGNRLQKVYSISLLRGPSNSEGGSLSYEVTILESRRACKVLKVELTGEE